MQQQFPLLWLNLTREDHDFNKIAYILSESFF
jgi:hypothetical protein